MQLHTIKRKTALKAHVQRGRGGKRGKTSGRGTKGQNARSGRKKRPEERDMIKKLPKLRGRGKNVNTSIQTRAFSIPVSILEAFPKGKISVTMLIAAGIIKLPSRQRPVVKILGGGTITKAYIVKGMEVSASARKVIEAAGGTIK